MELVYSLDRDPAIYSPTTEQMDIMDKAVSREDIDSVML